MSSGGSTRAWASAVVLAAALVACGGEAQPPAPERVPVRNAAAREFVAAVNSGSTDRVVATLTADAVVIDSGRRFAGTRAIRGWVDAEVTGVGGRISVDDEQPSSDGTVLTVDFRSSGFTGTDLRYAFETRGERVTRLTLGA